METTAKKVTIYAYATGHVRYKDFGPVMIATPCSKKKYEEQYRINWQTAYKWKAFKGGLRYPIDNLPGVLYPPIWGKFINMHIDRIKKDYKERHQYLDLQLALYSCTYNHTAIYRVGGYYYCHHILRGYRNLATLKRLL